MKSFRGMIVGVAGVSAFLLVMHAQADEKLDRITGDFDAFVVARGLQSPDGLAIHPITHELYVTEEDAGRVSVIRNGKAVPVIEANFTVDKDISHWAISPGRETNVWLNPRLVNPEGLAFSKDGHLFVTEDAYNGRLLEFIPDTNGNYKTARAIPVPLASGLYAWESVIVADDGSIFIAGSELENAGHIPSLLSGGVYMRDSANDWWVIDCGPLAGFSAVALSRDEDILVVGDEFAGGITCWDAIRQCPMADTTAPIKNVEGLTVLPDGSIAVAQESKPSADAAILAAVTNIGAGRLLRVDPTTGEISTLADGFNTIESVIVDPTTHSIYVTEDGSGQVIELRPRQRFITTEYLLRRTVQVAEAKQGLAPKKAPPFIKDFFRRVGVGIRDQTAASTPSLPRGVAGASKDLTLEELGAIIPMIAGKVKIDPSQTTDQPDPIVEIQFIQMFPGVSLYADAFATPNLCLYAALHKSGRIDRTQPLLGMTAFQYTAGEKVKEFGGAFLCIPIVSCSAAQDQDGVNMALAFLNLDTSPDLYMTLKIGKKNTGVLVIDNDQGPLISAEANVLDTAADGTEVVNVFMTGVIPRRMDDTRWLKIGNQDYWTLSLPGDKVWISHWINKCMPELVAQLNHETKDENIALDPTKKPGEKEASTSKPLPGKSAQREEERYKKPIRTSNAPQNINTTTQSKDEKRERDIIPPTAREASDDPLAMSTASNPSLTNMVFSRFLAAWGSQAF